MEKFSDKSPVFIVRVCPKNNFKYQGYTHLSELGQYYSLTIDDSKTRLYTNVNFLQK